MFFQKRQLNWLRSIGATSTSDRHWRIYSEWFIPRGFDPVEKNQGDLTNFLASKKFGRKTAATYVNSINMVWQVVDPDDRQELLDFFGFEGYGF
jgi:hypothetical protein